MKSGKATVTREQIKKWVIMALASDDELMEALVLKGGNAMGYQLQDMSASLPRTSYDMDYSMGNDFDDLEDVKDRVKKSIESTFLDQGWVVFDYKFSEKPKNIAQSLKDFWGGYNIEFKIVNADEAAVADGDLEKMRRMAFSGFAQGSSKIIIEISKFEFVEDRQEAKIDGLTFYIYSPEMIVFEKARALCQQLPEYGSVVPSHSPRPRARDFYDIYLLMDQFKIDPSTPENREMLESIFAAKKVPLSFLMAIPKHLAIHRQDWQNVLDTISAKEVVESFDFYVEFFVKKFGEFTFL